MGAALPSGMLAVFGAAWFALAVFTYTWGCQWRDWYRLACMSAERLGPRLADDVCLVFESWPTMRPHTREHATELLFFWVTNGDEHVRALIWDRLDVLVECALDARDRVIAIRCTAILLMLARYDAGETIITMLLDHGMMAFLHETVGLLDDGATTHLHLALTAMAMLATDEMKPIDVEVMLDTIGHALRDASEFGGGDTVRTCAELLNDIATTSKQCAAYLTSYDDILHDLVHEGLLHEQEGVARACVRVLITISAQRETHAASLALVNVGVFDQLGVLFGRTDWSDRVRRDTVRLMANIIADDEHMYAWVDSGLVTYMRSVSAEFDKPEFKEDCIICASNALCGTTSADDRELLALYGLERIAVMGLTYAPTSDVYTLCVEALMHVCRFQ